MVHGEAEPYVSVPPAAYVETKAGFITARKEVDSGEPQPCGRPDAATGCNLAKVPAISEVVQVSDATKRILWAVGRPRRRILPPRDTAGYRVPWVADPAGILDV